MGTLRGGIQETAGLGTGDLYLVSFVWMMMMMIVVMASDAISIYLRLPVRGSALKCMYFHVFWS